MIVGFAGQAGSGKDTSADFLVKNHGFVKVAFADPMKRVCRDIYKFTDLQLWGASKERNKPDKRYYRGPRRFIYPEAPAGAVWMPLSKGKDGYTLLDAEVFYDVTRYGWWRKKKDGRNTDYVRGLVDGVEILLHGFLMGKAPDGMVVDHVNGDGLDNRQANLRFCTEGENHANEVKRNRESSSSSFKGVSWDASREKWSVKLTFNGQTINLGRFDDEGEAALAYDKAAIEKFGSRARTNAELFLTPREALQRLGTEVGRVCYPNTWVDLALGAANQLLSDPSATYTQHGGVFIEGSPRGSIRGVVISDLRWPTGNEGQAIRRAGGIIVKLKRGDGLAGATGAHESEKQASEVPDDFYDEVIDNRDTPAGVFTLEQLDEQLGIMAKKYSERRKGG